jgi:hypothetical protein
MIYKELIENEFYLFMNGKLIYKKWLKTNFSTVFYTIFISILVI